MSVRHRIAQVVVWIVLFGVGPALAVSAEPRGAGKAEKPSYGAKSESSTATMASEQAKMARVREILAEMRQDVAKYQYQGLFLGLTEKSPEGLVQFPAAKFLERVDEISKIAKMCRAQMDQRQAAARAYYKKLGAPQLAVFRSCEESMDESATLIGNLRNSVNVVSGSTAQKGEIYYLELNRLERTIARINTLTQVCESNMKRADMICQVFESKGSPPKLSPTLTW